MTELVTRHWEDFSFFLLELHLCTLTDFICFKDCILLRTPCGEWTISLTVSRRFWSAWIFWGSNICDWCNLSKSSKGFFFFLFFPPDRKKQKVRCDQSFTELIQADPPDASYLIFTHHEEQSSHTLNIWPLLCVKMISSGLYFRWHASIINCLLAFIQSTQHMFVLGNSLICWG